MSGGVTVIYSRSGFPKKMMGHRTPKESEANEIGDGSREEQK
tara:strand:+ start:533 stop:658 length:126 start_codon:yes stop_codon:yes gene_type:complete